MNISNIALVRATNIIPFDGVVRPVSNSSYLCKNLGLPFSNLISDLLKEEGIKPEIDYSRITEEDYYDNYVKEATSVVKDYLPYVSDYNSCVLFSINGLCPDDNEHGFGNNIFSNKTCAIIEPLSNHLLEALSLHPTDTSIKGDVLLSNKSLILIEEETYNNLSIEEKEMLKNYNIKLFNGDLKIAVKEELINLGYTAEDLSLSASSKGFKDSPTKEELIKLLNDVALEYNLSQKKFFNLLTEEENMEEEQDNAYYVMEYYSIKFINELLNEMGIHDMVCDSVNIENHNFMYQLKLLIKEYGIDKYKLFVDKYNENLKRIQNSEDRITPEEIIDSKKRKAL